MTTALKSQPSSEEILAASHDMEPIAGVVEVDIPITTLWECFTQANLWPRWNPCFFLAYNRELILGKQLIWAFQPIRWWYLYKMPAIAKIVEVEPEQKVTWEVTVLPGFYARHTYHMEDLGNGRSRFGSWEKATGWSFRLMKWFWIPHFVFVKDRSLEGAKTLEKLYQQKEAINSETIPRKGYLKFWLSLVLSVALIISGIFAGWFYSSYVRQTVVSLAPGVKAIRKLAKQYPDAVFMPGHGPMAQATDLTYYADDLDFLYQSVRDAYQQGLSEDETAKQIDLSSWHLSILPSFHEGKLLWAKADSNIRWVYQILANKK